MFKQRRWKSALADHELAVRSFVATCQRITPAEWHRSPGSGKWSPAEVSLHVCRTYELGREALAGGESMRLRVSERYAWWLRTLMMPVIIATKRFPRGAPAPREVWPDAAQLKLFTQETAALRLGRVSAEVAAGLHRSAGKRGPLRFTHAYFGALTPYSTLRLLAAHTRHHERGLGYATAPRR